jgi:hypothetical protein
MPKRRCTIVMLLLTLTACSGPAVDRGTADQALSKVETPQWHQRASVTPSSGLHDGQTVRVTGSGFTPNKTLGIVECIDRGPGTGPADCNIPSILTVSADATGTVVADFVVTKTPTADTACGPTTCVVSVTELSLQPTEAGSAPISFA